MQKTTAEQTVEPTEDVATRPRRPGQRRLRTVPQFCHKNPAFTPGGMRFAKVGITLQMVKRYAHLSEAHTAGVVARMNAQIFGDV